MFNGTKLRPFLVPTTKPSFEHEGDVGKPPSADSFLGDGWRFSYIRRLHFNDQSNLTTIFFEVCLPTT